MLTSSAMEESKQTLAGGETILVREARPADARVILEYVDAISRESDFLTFEPGEHDFTEEKERELIQEYAKQDNRLFILGLIDGDIVAALTFAGGPRSRTRHAGEFGMSVRKARWGRGIGSVMLDTLIRWGRENPVVTKINLRVRTDNPRAIRLYERKGFVREGRLRNDMQIDGQHFDQYIMGLSVGGAEHASEGGGS